VGVGAAGSAEEDRVVGLAADHPNSRGWVLQVAPDLQVIFISKI